MINHLDTPLRDLRYRLGWLNLSCRAGVWRCNGAAGATLNAAIEAAIPLKNGRRSFYLHFDIDS